MAVYSILPDTNLKAEDIRDTLNANGGSVTNNTVTFFSSSAKLNKWSRYKPNIYPIDFININDSKEVGWWVKSSTNDCGISIPNSQEVATFIGFFNEELWKYKLPAGGSGQPYRLGDFRGYYPQAKPPLNGVTATNVEVFEGVPGQINVNFNFRTPDTSKELTWSDFNPNIEMPGSLNLGDFYFGALFKSVSSQAWQIAMGTQQLKDCSGTVTVGLPVYASDAGNIEIYPLLANKSMNSYYVSTFEVPVIPAPNTSKLTARVTIKPPFTWSLNTTKSKIYMMSTLGGYYFYAYIDVTTHNKNSWTTTVTGKWYVKAYDASGNLITNEQVWGDAASNSNTTSYTIGTNTTYVTSQTQTIGFDTRNISKMEVRFVPDNSNVTGLNATFTKFSEPT